MVVIILMGSIAFGPTIKKWLEDSARESTFRNNERKRQAEASAADEAKNAMAMAKNLLEKLGDAENTLSKDAKDCRKVALPIAFDGVEAQERLWVELLDASIELQRLEDHIEKM
jgi:hypothetical protein